MGQVDTNTVAAVMPKLIEAERVSRRPIAESRFLKEANKARETTMINPGGLYTPRTVSENYGGFAVAEGGAILGGSSPEYILDKAVLRALWKSMSWTGALERIASQWLTKLKEDPKNKNLNDGQLKQLAMNWAVADQVYSTFREYGRMENWFALQGGDNSAIGIVTAINHGTKTISCDGNSTAAGNRLINKGMVLEFRDGAGVLRNATADSYTVDQIVTHDATGNFHVSVDPTDVAADDTVHLVNGYAALPTGVPEYVDDQGTYKGNTRSNYPELLESVMIRNVGAPTIAPIHLRTQLSRIRGLVGYDVPLKLIFWMCKTQTFNWQSYIYANLIRQVGADKVRLTDFAASEFEWDGHPLNEDRDVPPDSVDMLNMATWRKIVQTKLQPYMFHQNQLLVNPINTSGQYLDSRQATIFSEYNWDMDDPRTNSVQSGFSFDYAEI